MKTLLIVLAFIFLSGIEVNITSYDRAQDKDNKDKFDKLQAQIDSLKASTHTFYFYEPLIARDSIKDVKNKTIVEFKPLQ